MTTMKTVVGAMNTRRKMDVGASKHRDTIMLKQKTKIRTRIRSERGGSNGGGTSGRRNTGAARGGGAGGEETTRSAAVEIVRTGTSQKNDGDTFGRIETLFADIQRRQQQAEFDGGRWEEIEGSWVLAPRANPVRRVVHFIGGAFVGASPQLSYRLFLEKLCDRGDVLIVATPYALMFDQLRCAEEAQFRFDRCMRRLSSSNSSSSSSSSSSLMLPTELERALARSPDLDSLPSVGVGHSLGSLLHLMIGSRYANSNANGGGRDGNVLLSFNNKAVTDAVPVLSPMLAPFTSSAAGVFEQVRRGPLGGAAELVTESLKGMSPPLVRQILPLLEQLQPLIAEVSDGTSEFMPPPEEARRLVRQYYGVNRNMLIKFRDDSIDETPELAQLLQTKSAISGTLDLTVKSLSGDHIRPLQQSLPPELSVNVPPEITTAAQTGTDILNRLVDLADDAGIDARSTAPLRDIASMSSDLASGLRGAEAASSRAGSGSSSGSAEEEDIAELVEVVVEWIESGTPRSQRLLNA